MRLKTQDFTAGKKKFTFKGGVIPAGSSIELELNRSYYDTAKEGNIIAVTSDSGRMYIGKALLIDNKLDLMFSFYPLFPKKVYIIWDN